MPSKFFNLSVVSDIPQRDSSGLFCLEVLRTGNWKYGDTGNPEDDDLIVTESDLEDFKTNFDRKTYWPVPVDGPVRRSDSPEDIGTAHAKTDRYDCGFTRRLEISGDKQRLFAYVEITSPDIIQMMDEGSLAYCSSELMFGWEDPSSRDNLNVFSGLGLTNRPFIKGMSPAVRVLNLSEISARTEKENKKSMNELDEQKAKVVALEEKTNSLAKQFELAEKAREAAEKQVKEYQLREKRAGTLNSLEKTIRGAMSRGALTPTSLKAFVALSEAIVDSGVREVNLMSPVDGDTNSIYRNTDGGGIQKCDLIDMLTQTIMSLPGDVVHVTPTGKAGSGDEAMLDDEGQMDLGDPDASDGAPFGDTGEDSDASDDDEDDKKPNKMPKLSERLIAVKPKSHGSRVTAEILLSEAHAASIKHKISPKDALKLVLNQHKIKSLTDVKN